MTIKIRERLFRAFFVISSLLLAGAGAAVWLMGFDGVLGVLSVWKLDASAAALYTVIGTAGFSGFFAVTVTGLVAFRSGKTVSVEIFFFTLWAFCQIFELTKIGSLVLGSRISSPVAYEIVTRIALFGRYCAVLAIFAGSLFSAGLKQERGIPVFMATLMAALLFASVYPLNSSSPGLDMLADRGIPWLAFSFEIMMVILTLIDYGIAWHNTKERENIVASVSVALCYGASAMVKATQSPMMALLAIAGLCAGSWIYMKTMHKYYLWR
jgi:hypothetical protein